MRCQNIRDGSRVFHFPLLTSSWASEVVGSAGIAPFWVVQMAPHAFANASACLNFSSFCKIKRMVEITIGPRQKLKLKGEQYPGKTVLMFWRDNDLEEGIILGNGDEKRSNKSISSSCCVDCLHCISGYASFESLESNYIQYMRTERRPSYSLSL